MRHLVRQAKVELRQLAKTEDIVYALASMDLLVEWSRKIQTEPYKSLMFSKEGKAVLWEYLAYRAADECIVERYDYKEKTWLKKLN